MLLGMFVSNREATYQQLQLLQCEWRPLFCPDTYNKHHTFQLIYIERNVTAPCLSFLWASYGITRNYDLTEWWASPVEHGSGAKFAFPIIPIQQSSSISQPINASHFHHSAGNLHGLQWSDKNVIVAWIVAQTLTPTTNTSTSLSMMIVLQTNPPQNGWPQETNHLQIWEFKLFTCCQLFYGPWDQIVNWNPVRSWDPREGNEKPHAVLATYESCAEPVLIVFNQYCIQRLRVRSRPSMSTSAWRTFSLLCLAVRKPVHSHS